MRPLAMLLGIVMGSLASVTLALALTLIVFAALPEYADRLAAEFSPLIRIFSATAALAAIAVAGFYGELRLRPWRRPVQVMFAVLCAVGTLVIWPRE